MIGRLDRIATVVSDASQISVGPRVIGPVFQNPMEGLGGIAQPPFRIVIGPQSPLYILAIRIGPQRCHDMLEKGLAIVPNLDLSDSQSTQKPR